MAWTCGYYNSVDGDRPYNSQQISEDLDGLIQNGIYQSIGDKLAVQPNSGMTIQIATGRGRFGGHWSKNDAPYLVTLDAADVVLNRWCAVCVRDDNSDAVRDALPYLMYSDFETTPTKPAMTRSELINDYCLAYVYIRAGATAVTAADIEDTRQDANLCGWVVGLIDQITPDTLYTQFTAIFNSWFNNLQDLINENTETMLINAMPVSVGVTLSAGSWTQTVPFTQTATVTGMNTTKSVIIQPSDSAAEQYSDFGINATGQITDGIVFTADNMPTEDIVVNILHMGQ